MLLMFKARINKPADMSNKDFIPSGGKRPKLPWGRRRPALFEGLEGGGQTRGGGGHGCGVGRYA